MGGGGAVAVHSGPAPVGLRLWPASAAGPDSVGEAEAMTMPEPRLRRGTDFRELGDIWGTGGPDDHERLDLTARCIADHVLGARVAQTIVIIHRR